MELNVELTDNLEALCDMWDKEIYNLNKFSKDKLALKLKLTLKDVGVNKVINLSKNSQDFIKKLNKFNEISGCAMPYAEAILDSWQMSKLYASADVGISKYSALYHFLDTVEDTTLNNSMEDAVGNIKYALSKDVSSMSSILDYFFKNADSAVLESATAAALAKCGPIGWSVELGLSVGDLIFNTGNLNENLIYVLAYGEAVIAYKYFTGDTDSVIESFDTTYYEMTSWTSNLFSIYAQLRIVGEDYYAKASNSRNILTKVVAGLCGEGQDEVEDYCRQNIDNIVSLCLNIGVPVVKKYSGSYLN